MLVNWLGRAALLALLAVAPTAARVPVWIDADPGCGVGGTVDVDDCWALAYALHAEGLEVRGISTVFGNTTEPRAFAATLQALLRAGASGPLPPVHRGAQRRLADGPLATDGSAALAAALARERLTILALGPVTNIAAVLGARPELAARVQRVVAVAGRRTGTSSRFIAGASPVLHFHDVNFRNDVRAFEVLLRAGVPVVLVPYEAASKVRITREDLNFLERAAGPGPWLAGISRGWHAFWELGLAATGFHPFDLLAVAHVAHPGALACDPAHVHVVHQRSWVLDSRDDLVADPLPQAAATYCSDVDPRLKRRLLDRLAGAVARGP